MGRVLNVTAILAVGALSIILYLSIAEEYVPRNKLVEPPVESDDLTLVLKRDSTLLVPVRNIINPLTTNLQILVYHKDPNANVTNIKLSTSSESILSFPDEFNLTNTHHRQQIFDTPISARHNGVVGNTTSQYVADVFYINKTGLLDRDRVTFDWPIKTMDFPMLTYFVIVLVGVFASKITSWELTPQAQRGNIAGVKGFIWLAAGPIITLLIFSNFETQVTSNLTSHLITNIALAFGFGFGFDKIVETTHKLILP